MAISGFPKFKQYTEAQMPLATAVSIGTEVFNTTYQVKMRSNGTSWEWLGVGRSTWENKPATAPLGQVICITDVGENGSLFRGNGAKWVRMHSIRYYDLAATVTLTNTLTETTLASVTLKGGLMGANGKLKIWPLVSATSNANNKTMYFKMESVTFFSPVYTTTSASIQPVWLIRNSNSESSQISFSSGSQQGIGTSGNAVTTASVDTAVDVTCTFSAKLTNGSDTFTLHGFFMEIV